MRGNALGRMGYGAVARAGKGSSAFGRTPQGAVAGAGASAMRRMQRKRAALAPLHKRQDMVSAHVSKELRKVVGRRAMRIKKGYVVKVMRGDHKGKEGKVTSVTLGKCKVTIEGVSSKKADGKEVPLFFNPSNLLITKIESEPPKTSKVADVK